MTLVPLKATEDCEAFLGNGSLSKLNSSLENTC